ncbi:hypothetical protein D3C78_1677180 [compost metagenome]
MLAAGRFDTAHHVDGIGIGDIGDDQADQPRLPTLQASCHLAWAIVELLDRDVDTLLEGVGEQVLFTIEIARHAGFAGLGVFCHITDGGAP